MVKDTKIALPKLGESILSATVVQWFKKVGDTVQEDEPLLEVTTDKVNSEIPSTVSGVLKEIIAHPDQEIQVGELLAIVTTDASAVSQPSCSPEEASSSDGCSSQETEMGTYFSPAVIRLAMEKGLTMDQLAKIPGTGAAGRVSKRDLELYSMKAPTAQKTCSKERVHEGVEKVKMSTMRKAIADNMVKSFYEAPHASLVTEVDVTCIVKHIAQIKSRFLEEHGFKLTITSFITKAIAEAVKEFPLINSSLEQDTIVVKRFVNIGIAVSVDQGIMVPVIKNCHLISLKEVAQALSQVAHKARHGELKVEDTREGTITMTNFGMSGTLMGIPIIRYPEVAILGVGAIVKRVAVLDDDTFGVRSMLHISLTFDHRVIDGMYGCDFLNSLKKHIETISLDF
jgi:2-oxoglutarate dehydrogenase E2 component (dihydrolipoamide succinyltransferase)